MSKLVAAYNGWVSYPNSRKYIYLWPDGDFLKSFMLKTFPRGKIVFIIS